MSELTQKKLGKLVGLKKEDFNNLIKSKNITLQKPRLIPIYKLGDEMALTSVFLTTLRLVKEFKNKVFSEAKMQIGGTVYVYSEVVFNEFPNDRVDGLILIVKSGTIRDAAILEVKNGKSDLEKDQLERYQKIAKKHSIPKFITISNQFVSDSSQSPVSIKNLSGIESRHFSWTYLLTIGHVLLSDQGTSVEDEDQVEILRETLRYLEWDKSGVLGLNQMKAGWVSVVDKINVDAKLKTNDTDVHETALSWQQEERDMALLLSRKLGALVQTGSTRFKGKLDERFNADCKQLVSNHRLTSTLRIKGAASDITVNANFKNRTVEFSVTLKAPEDKTLKGQIGWIKRQLETCIKRDADLLSKLRKEIILEIVIKKSPTTVRIISIDDIDSTIETLKGKDIKEFNILYLKDFGKRFSSPRKIVVIMEDMLLDYYVGIVQRLSKWEPSAPKVKSITESVIDNEEFIDQVNEQVAPVDIETGPRVDEDTITIIADETTPV
ncbi:MAG: hypothetical protein QM504_02935 [Pseudomonadota bacterium]